MTNKEAIEFAECLKNNWTINFDDLEPFCDMAIEAFKSISEMTSTRPQSTSDCISRQAVLALPRDRIRNMKGEIVEETINVKDIENIPPEQSEQRWIPCSKKLPEPNRSVLVQLSDNFVDTIQIMELDISDCEGDFFYCWRTQEMGIDFDMDDVVAWMPLPHPWEGGQE